LTKKPYTWWSMRIHVPDVYRVRQPAAQRLSIIIRTYPMCPLSVTCVTQKIPGKETPSVSRYVPRPPSITTTGTNEEDLSGILLEEVPMKRLKWWQKDCIL
jgi:hypothetical protein